MVRPEGYNLSKCEFLTSEIMDIFPVLATFGFKVAVDHASLTSQAKTSMPTLLSVTDSLENREKITIVDALSTLRISVSEDTKILMKMDDGIRKNSSNSEAINVLTINENDKLLLIESPKYIRLRLEENKNEESIQILRMLNESRSLRKENSVTSRKTICIEKKERFVKLHPAVVRKLHECHDAPSFPDESNPDFLRKANCYYQKLMGLLESQKVMFTPEEMWEEIEAFKDDPSYVQVSALPEEDPLRRKLHLEPPTSPLSGYEWNQIYQTWTKGIQSIVDSTNTPDDDIETGASKSRNIPNQAIANRPFTSKELKRRNFLLHQLKSSDSWKAVHSKVTFLDEVKVPHPDDWIPQCEWKKKYNVFVNKLKFRHQEFLKEIQHMNDLVKKINEFKRSQVYVEVARYWPDAPNAPKLDSEISIADMQFKNWKETYELRFSSLRHSSIAFENSINSVKSSHLYQDYLYRHSRGEVPRVRTPDCHTPGSNEWHSHIDAWKGALASVIDHRNQRVASERKRLRPHDEVSIVSEGPSSSKMVCLDRPPPPGYVSIDQRSHSISNCLDFNKIIRMDPATELIPYIQSVAPYYARLVAKKSYEAKCMIEGLSQGSEGLVPCGFYNKDNSCFTKFLHQDGSIHTCALCYYALGGMLNVHRLTQCPLLRME